MHPLYTEQALAKLTIKQLKGIAASLGVTPKGDKRKFETWANAILAHQYHQLEFQVSPVKTVDVAKEANPLQVGNTHFIGSFMLRCVSVHSNAAAGGDDYAVVWDCFDGDNLMGEIAMDWNCFWCHSMSFNTFATPQEAVADLFECLQAYDKELIRSESDVDFVDNGYHNFEAQVNNRVIAELPIDPFNHDLPWYVTVSGFEVYRAALWCQAANWVREQYTAGTLPKHQPQKIQVLRQGTSLDELLDKPFDELSCWEWEMVKGHSGYGEDMDAAAA